MGQLCSGCRKGMQRYLHAGENRAPQKRTACIQRRNGCGSAQIKNDTGHGIAPLGSYRTADQIRPHYAGIVQLDIQTGFDAGGNHINPTAAHPVNGTAQHAHQLGNHCRKNRTLEGCGLAAVQPEQVHHIHSILILHFGSLCCHTGCEQTLLLVVHAQYNIGIPYINSQYHSLVSPS